MRISVGTKKRKEFSRIKDIDNMIFRASGKYMEVSSFSYSSSFCLLQACFTSKNGPLIHPHLGISPSIASITWKHKEDIGIAKISTGKNVQHCYSSRKCNLKPRSSWNSPLLVERAYPGTAILENCLACLLKLRTQCTLWSSSHSWAYTPPKKWMPMFTKRHVQEYL